MKKLLVLLTVILCTFVCEARSKSVSVADFGAYPDDGIDDTEALRRAAEYCRQNKSTTLLFPAGEYILSDPMALDIERRAISGDLGRGIEVQQKLFNPQRPYATGLNFSGAHDLTISAHGATLMVQGWMEVLSFVGTHNVIIDGLAIDYRRPAATEGNIVKSTATSFEYEFDPALYCYIDSIVQGRFYFYSNTKQRFYYGHTGPMQLLRPGRVRVQSTLNPPLGDVIIVRYGGHYRPCIMLKEANNTIIRNCKIFSHPGMGIVGHLCNDITIDHLQITPPPGRFSSTNTDATHFTSCSGTITIKNSLFRGNGDDCTNIHNYYWSVYPQEDKRQVEVRVEGADLHAQSLDYPLVGDTVVMVDKESLTEKERFIVTAVNTSEEDWRVSVTLNRDFAPTLAETAFMVNSSRFPKVEIINNTVLYNNGRAFLLKVPHCHVAGNTICGSTLTAIKLGAELSWREAAPVEEALIENNYIIHCGEAGGEGTASAVMVTTEARQQPPFVNRNITIRNNTFDSQQSFDILLHDATDVHIEHNRTTSSNTDYVKEKNCGTITIK